MNLLSGHLQGLLTFAGRERRQPFWLWILIVYVAQTIVSIVGMVPLMASFTNSFAPLAQRDPAYLDQHPEFVQQMIMQTMMPLMQTMMILTGILSLMMTALIASAVIRRLHDSNRTGWWAAPNLALQIVMPILYAVVFPGFFAAFASIRPGISPEQANATMEPVFESFMALWVAGMLGFVMMIVLIVFLCQPSTEGPNRFGPEPLERV